MKLVGQKVSQATCTCLDVRTERIPWDTFRPLHAVVIARSSPLLFSLVHLLSCGPGPHYECSRSIQLEGFGHPSVIFSCGGRGLRGSLQSTFSVFTFRCVQYLFRHLRVRPKFSQVRNCLRARESPMLANWFSRLSQGQDGWFCLGCKRVEGNHPIPQLDGWGKTSTGVVVGYFHAGVCVV